MSVSDCHFDTSFHETTAQWGRDQSGTMGYYDFVSMSAAQCPATVVVSALPATRQARSFSDCVIQVTLRSRTVKFQNSFTPCFLTHYL